MVRSIDTLSMHYKKGLCFYNIATILGFIVDILGLCLHVTTSERRIGFGTSQSGSNVDSIPANARPFLRDLYMRVFYSLQLCLSL